jgi:hypothetical protein
MKAFQAKVISEPLVFNILRQENIKDKLNKWSKEMVILFKPFKFLIKMLIVLFL